MKRLLSMLLLLSSLCFPVHASAAEQDVLIVEVQVESASSASEEYLLVANNSGQSIDITGWHLQYFSASAANFTTPNRNISLEGTLAPQETFMAASSGYRTDIANASFGAGLAASGGHIRLVSGSGADIVQHDLIGWGTAAHPEGSAVAVAAKGQVYRRTVTTSGSYLDTDNNALDFENGSVVNVQLPDSTENDIVTLPTLITSSPSPVLTELLPDPAAPSTDANGEFVELFNPETETIDLTGYKIQTGSSYTYTYTFKSGTLAPGTYQAFYAPVTRLTLSNTSGQARLLNPDGETVSETAPYGKAPVGSSWMYYGGNWAWTGAPTPGAVNGAAVQGASPTTAKAATAKAASTKSKAAAKAKTSAAKAKSAKSTAAKTAFSDYKDPAQDGKTLPVNPLMLAVVGVPLVGYMVYEYRHDLGNFIAKLRRNRSRRHETRPLTSGR